MGDLEGLGLEFKEKMSGWLGEGATEYKEGKVKGEEKGRRIKIKVKIQIPDLAHFFNISDHTARLTGSVIFDPLGGKFPIEDGVFNLFTINPGTGHRQMSYTFRFKNNTGKTYFFHGFKDIHDDPGFDPIKDMTTLFVRVYEGRDELSTVYGTGIMKFKLVDSVSLMSSMTITGTNNPLRKFGAQTAFFSFVYGAIRDVFLRKVNPFYDTEYQNLVLSGRFHGDDNGNDRFFLVSGVHAPDFPWGDGETFSDVLLVIGNAAAGYRKYAITSRVLNGLYLDVKEGRYRYKGPLFELKDGYAVSFSEMRKPTEGLRLLEADIAIDFDARAYATTPLPFLTADNLLAEQSTALKAFLADHLPSLHLLGIHITPHTVMVKNGEIRLSDPAGVTEYKVEAGDTFGEAEKSALKNVREPTMLYSYICGLRPEARSARVQILANSMRNDPEYWIKDQADAFLGGVVSHFASKEMLMQGGEILVRDIGAEVRSALDQSACFMPLGEPLIEINNDHFPTAVFQRRIIEVLDPSGETCLALEEDMEPLRLESINSGREAVVASIRSDDKYAALESVLAETGFWEKINHRYEELGKPADFSIIIKPNFMFAYNKSDRSTYTDPELVNHLVGLILQKTDFDNIAVVEAQSTYGEYFTKRGVREVAEYLGYDINENLGYRVVDLTEDESEEKDLGKHLKLHPVPKTWKEAGFRISFAKNKTHAYAFYTLTLKNIYGALALANKFKEYHCDRDIYHTTIEYLAAYPVHYGLIDAFLSADGPFGIFADADPNPTETIIGGDDLAAVDWVGATKMGLDPMISKYMRLAIKEFGKPKIRFTGDSSRYRPWLNVPMILTLFAHYGLDADYYFGNLIYMASAYMDESHFQIKDQSAFIQLARAAMDPIKKAVFLLPGGERTAANRLVGRLLTWLGGR
jgi:uncharacterized protein (DUF362 family)